MNPTVITVRSQGYKFNLPRDVEGFFNTTGSYVKWADGVAHLVFADWLDENACDLAEQYGGDPGARAAVEGFAADLRR